MIEAQRPGTADPEVVVGGWHATLFAQSYRIFGCRPRAGVDAVTYWTTVAAALVFVVFGAAICIVLNCFTLPLGIFVEPIWRRAPRLRHLRVFGIPVIGLSTPIFLAIAAWRNTVAHGLWITLMPFVVTALLAVLMLGLALLLNLIRRRAPRYRTGGAPT